MNTFKGGTNKAPVMPAHNPVWKLSVKNTVLALITKKKEQYEKLSQNFKVVSHRFKGFCGHTQMDKTLE